MLSATSSRLRGLEMIVDGDGAALAVPGVGAFALNGHAGGQLAAHLDIPKRYYDRMAAGLRSSWLENVNHWMGSEDVKRGAWCVLLMARRGRS
jgi:hypothetical protein